MKPGIPEGIKIVVLGDYEDALASRLASKLADSSVAVENYTDAVQDEETLVRRLSGASVAVVIRERTTLTKQLLQRLSALELIVTTGSNTSVIDLDAGIPVCATRSMAGAAVEHTWALILAAARGLDHEMDNLRSRRWQKTVGTALEGKQMGILGLGRIGRRVAKVAQAFGMEVVAWSRSLTAAEASRQGVTAVSKEDLLTTSDIISLHLRLGDSSRGIIDASALKMMKPEVLLINTARAALIDETALVEAIHGGAVGGFAQDVFLEEPLPESSPLRDLPRTTLTPHLGYMTDRNLELFAEDTAEDVQAFYAGSRVRALN